MTDAVLDVAIVGCGVIGATHAQAIIATDGLRLVALADAVPEAAENLADRLAAESGARLPTFTSLGDALASVPVDLVTIATPSGLHVALAEEAVAAGKHVVIEKPLDVTMARGRRLAAVADEAERHGRTVSVISQHRFDPATVTVADAIRTGDLGRPTSANATVPWWRPQSYYDSGAWRGTWALDGGGAVMNQGVHTVDLLLFLLGEPEVLSADTALLAHERIEVEDVAAAWIRFESGALAVLLATTAAYPGTGVRLAVYGTSGTAVIEDDELRLLSTAEGPQAGPGGGGASAAAEAVPAGFAIGHQRQYAALVESIAEGRLPDVRVHDALRTLAVVRGLYLSATLGRTVAVADVLSGALDDSGLGVDG